MPIHFLINETPRASFHQTIHIIPSQVQHHTHTQEEKNFNFTLFPKRTCINTSTASTASITEPAQQNVYSPKNLIQKVFKFVIQNCFIKGKTN